MTKKQEGNIEYVNFKSDERQLIVPEQSVKKSAKSSTKKVTKTNKVSQEKVVDDAKPKVKAKKTRVKVTKPKVVKTKSTNTNSENNSKVAKVTKVRSVKTKQTNIKNVQKVQKKANTIKRSKSHKSDNRNVIHDFVIKNDLPALRDGKQECSLALISDATNKDLYIKAMKGIIKASRSNRKIKFNAA